VVIYEVNLTLEPQIVAEFRAWLDEHIAEMLTFEGFTQSKLLKVEDESLYRLTVWYFVESRSALEQYFNGEAARMREDGLRRFGDRFSATRRIMDVVD
tara:strand:+ start:336 stop:629 length:294 start_codon:yes stop_codon:yes gene_type:complete